MDSNKSIKPLLDTNDLATEVPPVRYNYSMAILRETILDL